MGDAIQTIAIAELADGDEVSVICHHGNVLAGLRIKLGKPMTQPTRRTQQGRKTQPTLTINAQVLKANGTHTTQVLTSIQLLGTPWAKRIMVQLKETAELRAHLVAKSCTCKLKKPSAPEDMPAY